MRQGQIRYIKFNWSKVHTIFKQEMVKAVSFGKQDSIYGPHFRFEMMDTDTFWPFGTDTSLERALRHTLITRVNYYSCLSVRAQKDAIDEIKIAIIDMYEEMRENITEYYANPWNFPPGYIQPDELVFDDDVVERIYRRIRREARIGMDVIKY